MTYLKNVLAFCLIIGPFMWGMSALHDRGLLARDAQAKATSKAIKSKTPITRINEAFAMLSYNDPVIRTGDAVTAYEKKLLKIKPGAWYPFDHDVFRSAGKA